jgi:anti-sigma regulatory factor (Ser/Thr protein kinase)
VRRAAEETADMTRTFDTTPASVSQARHAGMAALIDAGCGIDTVETAALLITELATNAVKHATGDEYTIAVSVGASRVHVEVRDADGRVPLRPMGEPTDAERGRGLSLVDTLASRWGVRPLDAGKAVWFDLTIPM